MNKKKIHHYHLPWNFHGLVTKALPLQKQSAFIQHKSQDWTEDEILAFLIHWVPVSKCDRTLFYSWCQETRQTMHCSLCWGVLYTTDCTEALFDLEQTKHVNWGAPPQDCNFVKNSHMHIIKNGALEKKDKLQRYLLRKLRDCRHIHIKKHVSWTTLVVQWLRIHLPMQRTWVRSLVREDSTCLGASKAMNCNYWSLHPELLLCNKRSHGNEKFKHCN